MTASLTDAGITRLEQWLRVSVTPTSIRLSAFKTKHDARLAGGAAPVNATDVEIRTWSIGG